jgi:hypothetical protein
MKTTLKFVILTLNEVKGKNPLDNGRDPSLTLRVTLKRKTIK